MRSLLVLIPAALATACNTAQTPPEQAQTNTAASAAMPADRMERSGANPVTSETYISRAAMGNMYEIESGRLAINQAGSAELREIGRMMVNDHTSALQDLKASAERAGMHVPAICANRGPDSNHLQRSECGIPTGAWLASARRSYRASFV